jgi:hypothetical protein
MDRVVIRMIAGTVILAALVAPGCARPSPRQAAPGYASAAQVEEYFRGRTFVLGMNSSVATVRPPDWPGDRWLRLPFWLGENVMVPRALRPKEGGYYVISEARLLKPLGQPGEWLIEAGSSLIKSETLFVTTRTHYLGAGKILPTIVQFVGMRDWRRADGALVRIPILREVSLPMKWTLGGNVPRSYARFHIDLRSSSFRRALVPWRAALNRAAGGASAVSDLDSAEPIIESPAA